MSRRRQSAVEASDERRALSRRIITFCSFAPSVHFGFKNSAFLSLGPLRSQINESLVCFPTFPLGRLETASQRHFRFLLKRDPTNRV